jgi:hypothetical protein
MTWIKPSFLWMMERSGWASKPGQERVLSIMITRQGWEEALANAVLTAPSQGQSIEEWREALESSPIRVQWDPERTLKGGKAEQRSIQVGISRDWSRTYTGVWIKTIADITPLVAELDIKRKASDWAGAEQLLPKERPYPRPTELMKRIGCGVTDD